MRDLDVGLLKPTREKGEPAKEFNNRVRARGEQFKGTLDQLGQDETMRQASPSAKRAVYERALNVKQMERAEKLSGESVSTERGIEALRE